MSPERRVIVIAGPNGAGKSTFAPEKAAIRAGRLMLEELHRHAAAGESFAFETTLSGRGYAPLIQAWQAAGYRVHLVFLRLPTVEMAVERVAARVAQGGHDIPPQVIARRFIKGWRNFEQLYRGLVDTWQVFDNAGDVAVLLEEGERT